jgi:hypothetical protein
MIPAQKQWQSESPVFTLHRLGDWAVENETKMNPNKSKAISLEVTFPPHDPTDAGSIPAEVVEFFRTEKFGNEVLRKGL